MATLPLTTEQIDALREYARTHGRTWKQSLRDEWMVASTIGPLQQLRNTHGPRWLVRFTLDTPVTRKRATSQTEGELLDRAIHSGTLTVTTEHGTLRGRRFGTRQVRAALKLKAAGKLVHVKSESTSIRHCIVYVNTFKLVTK